MQGAVDVDLGGKNRILKFDFNAICEAEAHFGVPAHEILNQEKMGLKTIRDLLYIGLQEFNGKEAVDAQTVGIWLETSARAGQFQYVVEKMSAALQYAIQGLEGPEGNATAPEAEGAETTDEPASTGQLS